MSPGALTEHIRLLANFTGIDALGFAPASLFTDYALQRSKRSDPRQTVPDAQAIIVAGIYIGEVTLPVWDYLWYGRTS